MKTIVRVFKYNVSMVCIHIKQKIDLAPPKKEIFSRRYGLRLAASSNQVLPITPVKKPSIFFTAMWFM